MTTIEFLDEESVIPTKGVKNLLGNPKKAIFKIAFPLMLANILQTIYNLTDTIWVSGLGSKALSAVGFFFPFFFISMSLGMGVGIGAGSAISRAIGAKNRTKAGNIASHAVILAFIISIIYSLILFFSIEKIYNFIGVSTALDLSLNYAKVLIFGTFLLLFLNVGASILRSEGDAKRSMIVVMIGVGLNIILDPIFIYVFKLGVTGVAWASLIGMAVSGLIMIDWLFLKKNTYVPLHIKNFKFSQKISKEILKVGIPASIQHMIMALSIFFMNIIIVNVAGSDGIAVYTTGWRIFMLGSMPVFGIASAITAIAGSAYGAKDYKKLNTAYIFALKVALGIEILAGILIFANSSYIVLAFTYSKTTIHIAPALLTCLKIISLSYPALAIGPISSSMFQGIGKGINSLILTLLRSVILTIPLILIFAYWFQLGLSGVWWGIVLANLIGSSISYFWASSHLRKIKSKAFI